MGTLDVSDLRRARIAKDARLELRLKGIPQSTLRAVGVFQSEAETRAARRGEAPPPGGTESDKEGMETGGGRTTDATS